ncbi:TIGR04222 domain-containing membrane protein [Saccharothrix hoggarensis]|uniref:TIGR04222 domain-containing membrane protein n=1 Tax=Saccharothrix hoggarensis TaxID=913853 RepID=A0ABW3QHE6_9PSEU
MGPAKLGPEEQAFLVGGPGRAAEVAVVALAESGAVRISREGLVSAVAQPGRHWSPLQAQVLRSLPGRLGDVITATAGSPEAHGLRQHLVDGGLVVPPGRRKAVRAVRGLLVVAAVAAVVLAIALDLSFGVAAGAVVGALVLVLALRPATRPLTGAGRKVVRRARMNAVPTYRLGMVVHHGLLGRVGRRYVWQELGLSAQAASTLRRKSRGAGSPGGASCGGGCGSCSSSSCGSGSSGSDGGSSGSDSGGGSSDSGGGGCGGGGGGD